MSEAFKQFTMFQPMQTTTTSTTWSGLQSISSRCYGCIYSCFKHGTLICCHTSRTVANGKLGQECVSFVPREPGRGQAMSENDTYNQVLEDLNMFCWEILERYNHIDYDGVNAIKGEVISLLNRQKAITEQEIDHTYMRLPVDADGVPIRPGDTMQFRNDAPVRVDSIGNSRCYTHDFGWFGGNGAFYGAGTLSQCRHVQPGTVEDVLADFASRVLDNGHQWGLVSETTTADYAERIRKAVENA